MSNYPGLPKDPLDRALTYREEGTERKDLALFGFLQSNRGRLGLSSRHSHEVAWSCKPGVKLVRYKCVEVVRVPAKELEHWRIMNKNKCESDALMPKYSDRMRLACMTKTHFTHSQKLYKDGNRTLFNEGKVPLVYDSLEGEALMVQTEGPVVSVYREELWYDTEALIALMQADNDDSEIQMGEDEMQMLGRVEDAFDALAAKTIEPNLTNVLAEMKSVGLRCWSEEHTMCFIEYRLRITKNHAECLRQCVFHSVSGRIVVNPADYKVSSAVDVRALWLKVCIIMRQYMCTLMEKYPPSFVATGPFTSRQTGIAAPKLRVTPIKELSQDVKFLGQLEGAVGKLLTHYKVTNAAMDKVMSARVMLFNNVGKLAIKAGVALEAASTKAAVQKKVLTQEQRTAVSSIVAKGQFVEIESKYRQSLIDANALIGDTLPSKVFVEKETDAGAPPDTSAMNSVSSVENLIDATGDVKLSVNIVLLRLNAKSGVDDYIRLTTDKFLPNPQDGV